MSSLIRNPPAPPPKPKGYMVNASYPQKMANDVPQDSDTDSGICADSDQSSPRQQPNTFAPSNYNPTSTFYRRPVEKERDYLTPNSARRLFDSPRRTLPPRPNQRPAKGFRVRFADEVDSGASTSSSASEHSNTSPRELEQTLPQTRIAPSLPPQQQTPLHLRNNNVFNTQFDRPLTNRYDSLDRKKMPRAPSSYTIEDIESLPEPPSYAIAVQRLRSMDPPRESVRDSVIRQSVQDTLSRTRRDRSTSLPRGGRDQLGAFYGERPMLDYQMNRLMPEQLLGSLDNLRINTDMEYALSSDDSTLKRRRLPMAPLMGSATNIPDAVDVQRERTMEGVRQPAYMRQRRMRGLQPAMGRRSASVGRYEDAFDYRPPEPSVRAQLVALDHRGFRTVLVEKTSPGPFGFYIATGVMSGQRGIFISRVSLSSLSPMLSVGDEILYVDDELVKGRSLEHVQSLIAGKTAVVIVLLPTVGNLC